jgi:hypothetical protein
MRAGSGVDSANVGAIGWDDNVADGVVGIDADTLDYRRKDSGGRS